MTRRLSIGTRIVEVSHTDRVRFAHVVKHLYARRERWDLAVPELPFDLRAHARSAGCVSGDLSHRWRWNRVGEACRDHVLGDHERYYLPAAAAAVKTGIAAGDHAVVETRQGPREIVVGANAVQVLLGLPADEGVQRFVTALRDPPSGCHATNADFHRKAVRKLRDKASLGSGEPP